MPQITGICVRVDFDAVQNASARSSHDCWVACLSLPGQEPPPFSTEPMPYCRTSSGVIAAISGWVICPTFSSSVIPARICWIRCSSCGFPLSRLSTFGQSESVGRVFSMRAHPSRSSAGAPITGCAGGAAAAGTAAATPPSIVRLVTAASARNHVDLAMV